MKNELPLLNVSKPADSKSRYLAVKELGKREVHLLDQARTARVIRDPQQRAPSAHGPNARNSGLNEKRAASAKRLQGRGQQIARPGRQRTRKTRGPPP